MKKRNKASVRPEPSGLVSPFDAAELVRFVERGLAQRADAAAAAGMAAYMKTTQPFYGVMNTPRRELMSEACHRFRPASASDWKAGVTALFVSGKGGDRPGENTVPPRRDSKMCPPRWHGRRELFYASCDFAAFSKVYHNAGSLPLFKSMIIESGWWDTVDWIAGKMIGRAFDADPVKVAAAMERWIDDNDLWVRRAAVICQLNRKRSTDAGMLGRFCLARAHETDFFMRKAIGWSLRQHARTDAAWVRGFLKAHRGRLSSLSLREASKHL